MHRSDPIWRSRLGGSDAAAIVLPSGAYLSQLELWAIKTGRSSGPPESAAMRLGRALEPVIAAEYERAHGVALVETEPTHAPGDPLIWGSIDRLPAQRDGSLIEIKTSSRSGEWGTEGTDEIPQRYLVQVQWYLGLGDYDRAIVAALIGGRDLREYVVRRDDELISTLYGRAHDWWDRYVLHDTPPTPDGSESASRAIKSLYARSRPVVIQSTPDLDDKIARLVKAKKRLDEAEAEKAALEQEIKLALGEAESVASTVASVLWRSTRPRTKTDWESVAKEHGATATTIAAHTTSEIGSRRLTIKEV